MPDELRLTLLGKPQLTLGGAPVIGFTYRKSLALLFYLAVTGRPHSRDTLIGLLWPETTEANARSNLRKTLTDLRRQVAPFLDITRHEIAFDPDSAYALDVAIFESGVADTSGPNLERLQAAVDLYRGDFLEGFYVRQAPGFEEWTLVQRARLRERALEALHALARYHSAQGASGRATAIDYTTRLLALEPWREDAQRQLMQLLALSGRRGAALVQYEVCRQMLETELGVEPGLETTRLYEQIRDGALGPEHPPLELQQRRPAAAALAPTLLHPEDVPEPDRLRFVAREGALAWLDAGLDAALNGQGQVVFVTGGPGRGKTALMHAFARRALEAHPDLLVAVGNCNAFSGVGDPYLPFRQALGALTGELKSALSREQARRLWSALPLAVQALLAHGPHLIDSLVPGPELLLRAAAVAPAEGDGWLRELTDWVERDRAKGTALEPSALLAQAADTLCAIADQRPLLLVLDDLHWSDTGSVSLLFHLGRQLAEQGRHPMLVVGGYRPAEISLGQPELGEGQHPLSQVLAEFGRYFGAASFDLAGLDETENRRFVDQVVDIEPNRLGERFRAGLYDRTRGHALFTVELLRAMQERGDLVLEGGAWVAGPSLDWGRLPTRVESVIAGRLGRLDEKHNEMLAIASVEGETFMAQVVAQVLNLPERQALRALSFELGRRHRLVSEAGEEKIGERYISRYRFAHALYQEYLYTGLSPGETRLLHRQIGTALEEVYGDYTDQIAVQLALHFAEAGVPEKAWFYYGRAGAAATRIYANAEAIDHYRRALEWADRSDVDTPDLIHFYTGLGRAHELNSEFERAVAVYEEMERVAQERGDPATELAALMARMIIQAVPSSVHDPTMAQSLGEKALAIARGLDDAAAEAKILWSLALAYFYGNRLTQATTCGERALALARQLDLRGQLAQTLNGLGSICYTFSGRIKQAQTALREAGSLWRELGNLPMLADSLSSSSIADFYAGDLHRALVLSQEAFEISTSISNTWGLSYSQWKLGLVFAELGEWSQAQHALLECTRLGWLAGFVSTQTYARADLAALYGDLGAVKRGLKTIQQAISAGDAHGHLLDRAPVLAVLAWLQLLDGNLEAAEEAIKAAQADPFPDTWRLYDITVHLADAEIALATGENERAAAVIERLLDDLRGFGVQVSIPYALHLLGRALVNLGQLEQARARWLEAREQATAMGSRRILWRILYALSQIEPDPAQVECLRAEARQVLTYIVDHIDAPDLRQSFLSQPEVQRVLEVT